MSTISNNSCCSSINPVASFTISTGALVTIGAVVGAVMVPHVAALVAGIALAVFAACFTFAAITAWAEVNREASCKEYFSAIGEHLLAIIPAVLACIGTILCQAAVEGVANGVSKNISRRIGGADTTIEVHHT